MLIRIKQALFQKALLLFVNCILFSSINVIRANQIDFNTIPKSGTILIYGHMDDDLIWMLPFWDISEKFIGGIMPNTPTFEAIIHEQQAYLNNNGYDIDYESNWITPWGDITHEEYAEYYWFNNEDYQYLKNDYLIAFWSNSDEELVRREVDRIKSKIEHYIASSDVERIITHNNWGETGHQQHRALNKAVRELAVKYRKDVWMLGCDNEYFIDVTVPEGITYTWGSFDDPELYLEISHIYGRNNCWTWGSRVPSGDHKFIRIVDGGVDKSDILMGSEITYSGPFQIEPGAYLFDGDDDYLTLPGNSSSSFTIAMKIRPDQIKAMDISRMTEYPFSETSDRNFYLNNDGRVSARIFDGNSQIATSITALTAGEWAHIVMTGNGSNLKLYVNGVLENTINTGTAITGYYTPELVIGQAAQTESFFNGQIHDVRLFNYELNESEIAELCGTCTPITYTINAVAGVGGSIDPSGDKIVHYGTNQTYTITPEIGYGINDVKIDNISYGVLSTYTFTNITDNHNISVEFVPVPTYTIISGSNAEGTISPQGSVTVNHGANQTFTIAANAGYQISDVLIDNVSVGAVSSYTFSNVTTSHTIYATYSKAIYTVTGIAGPNGLISPSGTKTVDYGTNQTYTITPGPGFKISDVVVDDVSVGTVTTYTFNNIANNHTISATFTPITYTISTNTGIGGAINPNGDIIVNHGTNQTLTISSNTGYLISDVIVDDVSVGPISTYTFSNITENHTISATFTPITYIISCNPGAGGEINPNGDILVNHGADQTFTIIANAGFQISDVLIDNVSAGIVSSYTFNNVTTNHTISASYSKATFTITGIAGPNGLISPSGTKMFDYGTNQTYTITPGPGYKISDVIVDDVSVGAVTTYTFNIITKNHTISATFTPITFIISTNTGIGGVINPNGDIAVNKGANQTFTIVANAGYQISDVLIDNISVGVVSSYTFNNVTTNHTISATYSKTTFTITGIAGPNGLISPSGTKTVDYGTNQTYTITPGSGYKISDVIVDDVSVGAVTTYTFNNIAKNHTISATFTPITFIISTNTGIGGVINPNGDIAVNKGANQTFTIVANAGYQISDVLIDNISVGVVSSYTFNNVTTNHTISATYSKATYTITGIAGPNGLISPSGAKMFDYGTNQTYTITPGPGYKISDVIVDDVSVGAVTTYTFNNITKNHTISATFTPITYIISSNAGTGGEINPNGDIVVNHGTSQVLTITPNTGYKILHVIVDDVSIGPISTYTFSDITENHTISVTFEPDLVNEVPGTPESGILVSAYPNPFKDEFFIDIVSPVDYQFDMTIISMNDNIVYISTNMRGNAETMINLDFLPSGLYLVNLTYKGKTVKIFRMVKSE